MALTALLVFSLATAAGSLGAVVGGMLAALPVLASMLAVFTHRQQGGAAASALLRGTLAGMAGFVTFVEVIGLLVVPAGLAPAFAAATVLAVAVQTVTIRLRPPAPASASALASARARASASAPASAASALASASARTSASAAASAASARRSASARTSASARAPAPAPIRPPSVAPASARGGA
jgi:hypothetical protein